MPRLWSRSKTTLNVPFPAQRSRQETRHEIFCQHHDVKDIRELNDLGLLDGVAADPSLILKSGGKIAEVTKQICDMIKAPVSAEVTATECPR